MTTHTTTNTTPVTAQTVDRLISAIAKRNVGLLVLADRAAIAIIQNPSDLAGRSIPLLDALSGIKAQKNVLAFFTDFLQNEIIEKKSGGFILGKKRQEWNPPILPENGLTPTSYTNTEKAAATKAARAEKAAATKAAKAAAAVKAEEGHSKRESDLLARERAFDSRMEAATAAATSAINAATAETAAVKIDLKAESDRLRVALSEKSRLQLELNAAQRRIAELEDELAAMRQALATATATATAPVVARKGRKQAA